MIFFDNIDLNTCLIVIATCYFLLIQALHFKRRVWMNTVAMDALANRAAQKEAKKGTTNSVCGSTWRVHNLLTAMDMRLEAWISMSMRGLLSTYAIPSIASLLHSTGGFQEDIQRRYADMELLIREFNENAVDGGSEMYPEENNGDPQRAITSIQRVNAIHSKYASKIKYKDMLYVWSVFAITPSMFCDSRWSIRQMNKNEKECVYWHWVDIGHLLNLDITAHFHCYQDVLLFKQNYEDKHMKYSKSNYVVSDSTIDYFLGNITTNEMFKSFLKPLLRHIIAAGQHSKACREALGLPTPNILISIFLDIILTSRALICRWLLPPLPLMWKDRLTGLTPYPVSANSTPITTKKGEKKGVIGRGCPFQMFYPTRSLDFNNTVYTPQGAMVVDSVDNNESSMTAKGYIIEHMGPRSIDKGKLVSKPMYVGHYDPNKRFSLY